MVRKVMPFVMLLVLTSSSVYAQGADKDSAIDYKAMGIAKYKEGIDKKLTKGEIMVTKGDITDSGIVDILNESLVYFDKAIELNPNDGEAYCLMGLAKSDGGKGYKFVREPNRAYEDWFIKDRNGAQRDLKIAMELLTKSILANPKDEKAYFYRGLAKERIFWNGREIAEINRDAREDFSKVIELDPTNAEAYYYRGYYGGKIEDLDKAIELNPKYAEAYDRRCVDRGVLGDHKGALADISKYIELRPKSWEAYRDRGILKELDLADYEGAIADYEKAKELAPDAMAILHKTLKEDIQAGIDELKAKLARKDNKK